MRKEAFFETIGAFVASTEESRNWDGGLPSTVLYWELLLLALEKTKSFITSTCRGRRLKGQWLNLAKFDIISTLTFLLSARTQPISMPCILFFFPISTHKLMIITLAFDRRYLLAAFLAADADDEEFCNDDEYRWWWWWNVSAGVHIIIFASS